MSRVLVAVGKKPSSRSTTTMVYALRDPNWHPQDDVRADPDLKIDVDEIHKQRLEEHDLEDLW